MGRRVAVLAVVLIALGVGPVGPVAAVPTAPTTTFVDVGPSHPFAAEISWLAEQGISTGWSRSDGSLEFRPNGTVTREAMAAFLYRAAGSPPFTPPTRSPFVDVLVSSPFYPAVAWLSAEGISTGWSRADGTREFRPSGAVTREAMAAFLYRAAHFPVYHAPTSSPFVDVPTTSALFTSVAWLAAEGISVGTTRAGARWFEPSSVVTRAAMAAFLYRAAHPVDPAPPVPIGGAGRGGDGRVVLSWSAVGASDLSSYRVMSAPSPTGPWSVVGGAAAGTTSLALTALPNQVPVWLRVAAVDTGGHVSSPSAAVVVTPGPTRLTALASLTAGQHLWSASGTHRLVMQADGNLVLYPASGGATWASGTAGVVGAWLKVQTDGNLVVYPRTGAAAWASGTQATQPTTLTVQDDGNLVLRSSGGLPLWAARGGRTGYRQDVVPTNGQMTAGQSVVFSDGQYRAVMQSDGNFVVYTATNRVLFATGTAGNPGASIVVQSDGNLVVYAPGGRALWASGTSASGAWLVMQGDGNLVLYDSGGHPLWSSIGGKVGVVGDDYPEPWRSGALDQYIDSWGYYSRECTSFVAWRLHSRNGYEMPWGIGNGGVWRNHFPSVTNNTPAVGAIAEQAGHVAWVAAVNADGTVTVEEYNVPGGSGAYNVRTRPASQFWYIHVKDL